MSAAGQWYPVTQPPREGANYLLRAINANDEPRYGVAHFDRWGWSGEWLPGFKPTHWAGISEPHSTNSAEKP